MNEASSLEDSQLPFAADAARDAVIVVRIDSGEIISSNRNACELLGYTEAELVGMGSPQLHPKGSLPQIDQEFQTHITRDGSYSFDIPVIKRDGTILRADFSSTQVELAGVPCLIAVFHNVDSRTRTEKALRQSESHYRLLFQTLDAAFALHRIIRDETGRPCSYRFLEVNDAFEVFTGIPRDVLLGRTVFEVLPDTESYWIEQYGHVVDTGETIRFQNFHHELNRHFEVTAYRPQPEHFAVIFADITDRIINERSRIQMERKLQESQKLESLGVLAGGIAHDFNNILMAILGHADIALQDLSPLSPVRESLHEIDKAAHRAADLCRQMLAYAGKGQFVIETLDICVLIDEMAHLLKSTISKNALLNLSLNRSLPRIQADASQVRQIVMNLVTNASEAIGNKSGSITISTGAMECDKDYLSQNWPAEKLQEGVFVYLEVSDTGCGMDEATRRRVFEPFFTTKFTGRGLGMSAVLGIVRSHQGAVKYYSEVNKGTTCKVLFPAATEEESSSETVIMDDDAWKASGTVLLVDDEETVRVIGKKMLMRLGFDVITAEDGREGLSTYQEYKDKISLVVLDLTMPHMNGEEAFRELRRLNPELRIVISSGYTEKEITCRFAGKGVNGFIQKPYKVATLREKLQAVLES